MRYRRKPTIVDAFQLPAAGDPMPDAFEEWCNRVGFVEFTSERDQTMTLRTPHGDVTAEPGDWIIAGTAAGDFYPCKPDLFDATYEPTLEPDEKLHQGMDSMAARLE